MVAIEPDNLDDALEFIEEMFSRHFALDLGNRVLNVYEDVCSSEWFFATQNEFGYLMITKDPEYIIELARIPLLVLLVGRWNLLR